MLKDPTRYCFISWKPSDTELLWHRRPRKRDGITGHCAIFLIFPCIRKKNRKNCTCPVAEHSPPLILKFTVGNCSPTGHPRRRSSMRHVSAPLHAITCCSTTSRFHPANSHIVQNAKPPPQTVAHVNTSPAQASHLSNLKFSTLFGTFSTDNRLPRLQPQAISDAWSHNWSLCSFFFFLVLDFRRNKEKKGTMPKSQPWPI